MAKKQREQRLRDPPQPAVVDCQVKPWRNVEEAVLVFGARVEACAECRCRSGLHGHQGTGEPRDVEPRIAVQHVDAVGLRVNRYPRAHEVVLYERDPPACSLRVVGFLRERVETVFEVFLFNRPAREANERLYPQRSARGARIRAAVTTQLPEESGLPVFGAAVFDRVLEIRDIGAAFERVTLQDCDARAGRMLERDHKCVFAVCECPGGFRAGETRTPFGRVCAVGSDKPALCGVVAVSRLLQKAEREVRPAKLGVEFRQ